MNEKPSTSLCIALAEDDANLRKTYVAMLKRLGHAVPCAAANGVELLETYQEHEIDLVLVDLEMPVLDGLVVAEEISKNGIPVVLVSGHPDAEEIVVECEPIATRVMKPVTIDELQRAIAIALTKKRS